MKNAQIKILLLMRGNAGKEVANLKKSLRKVLSDAATSYPGLTSGNAFDTATAKFWVMPQHPTPD